MTTPTHPTPTDEQVAKDFELLFTNPEGFKELAALDHIKKHLIAIEAQNLQLAAEVERWKDSWRLAVSRCGTNFHHVPEVVRALDWITISMEKLLSTPNPGKGLLEELKADSDRLMHIFKNPFNKDGFPWRTREEIDLAIDSARKGKEQG